MKTSKTAVHAIYVNGIKIGEASGDERFRLYESYIKNSQLDASNIEINFKFVGYTHQ